MNIQNINPYTMMNEVPKMMQNSGNNMQLDNRQNYNNEGSNLHISKGATELFNLEKEMFTTHANFNSDDQAQVNKIHDKIDKLMGTGEVKLSSIDKKDAHKIYNKIDGIFSDGIVTKDEEKELTKLNIELEDIDKKYQKPLTKDQQTKLNDLFAQLDKLYIGENSPKVDEGKTNTDEVKHFLNDGLIAVSTEDQQDLNKDKLADPLPIKEVLKLINDPEHPWHRKLTSDDEKAMVEIFEKMIELHSNDNLSKEDWAMIDKFQNQMALIGSE
mgnify:CR=1 FL=1